MAPRRITLDELAPQSPLAQKLRALASATSVTLDHDGTPVTAREGEPVALALLAAGHLTLTRSIKYHRPRGPVCLRGACDGCLVRIDGLPSQMACVTPARSGMRVESQNTFPNAALDVLRVTDWFFPKHMDHHHLMVDMGSTLNRTMQSIARRMAGLGTLPDEATPPPTLDERAVDALVVGAGSSGTAAANALTRGGLRVLLVDEEPRAGGARLDLPDDTAPLPSPDAALTFLSRASAVATYANGTLVLHENRPVLVHAPVRVFATGCHESVGTFAQNDLPGVVTARAFARALSHGVLLGERIVLAGDGPYTASILRALDGMKASVTRLPPGCTFDADGGRAVKKVTYTAPNSRARSVACDLLVVDDAPSSAYELAGQAGAGLTWDASRRCFVPQSDEDGVTLARGVYVTGSLRLGMVAHSAREEDGRRVAARALGDLRQLHPEEAL